MNKMGRYRGSKKRRKKLCKRRKAHESDPEFPGTETRSRETSPAWNSLDEESLLDYARNAVGNESDEMEVTKRLSCLNFSVIPCAMDPEFFSCGTNIPGGGESDAELYSELTSTTHLDVLPGERDLEECSKRQGRKRASRRRPSKRTKKMKSSYSGNEFSAAKGKARSTVVPLVRFNPLSCSRHPTRGRNSAINTALHPVSRSARRMEVEEDSMSCLFSDTSAVCDIEMPQDVSEELFDDHTPPALPNDSGYPCNEVDFSGNESELSGSTTDSGCEGDDEESSVERTSVKLPGWWDREPLQMSSADEDEEKFSQILDGAFPLMSGNGQRSFRERLALSEFKHPGSFGIRGSGRKKRRKPTQTGNSPTLKEVNQRISSFVTSNLDTELKFEPVSRMFCRTISNLAHVYNLECVIEQKRRLPVASPLLRKTVHTRLPARGEVEPILRNHGRESPTALLMQSEGQEPMAVVGGRMPPIDTSNLGNRMLQEMGWRPGMGLGPNGSGIQDPILACIRPKRMGLGYQKSVIT